MHKISRAAPFRKYYLILPPRIYVLIALLLFSLAPIATAQSPDLSISWIITQNERHTSMGAVFRPSALDDPDSYEARLGSDGAWVDVGSALRRNGNQYLYTFRGLSPDTEYTFSIRATGGGNTGAPASVTARTLTAATDYNFRLCKSGGLKLIFSGLDTPGNALYSYINFITAFYDGQASTRKRSPYLFAALDKTTREVTLGPFNPGERLYVNFTQVLTADTNQLISSRWAVYFEDEPIPSCSSSKSRRDDEDDDDKSPPPTPTRVKDSLNHLPPGIQVSNWVEGAQGRRVGFDAISRADLIKQGILDAADLYGYITPGVEVCFAAHGRLVFLDAAYAPRRLLELSSYQRAGMTCATIDRGGTVVLLQSGDPPAPQPSQPPSSSGAPLPTAEASQPQSQALSDCEVQPWANLKFRQRPPRGLVLGVTATRDWLPASEKRQGYFKVRLWGREGWISGDYVYLRGDCGA